jgi:ornithine--oxo-acid transaminase
MVMKVAPPLVVTEDQADEFVASIAAVMELVHASGSFWEDALNMVRRAVL